MGDAPTPPTPPDPVTTASAQGQANVQTATAQTLLNNPNQVTPYGNVSYAQTGSYTQTMPDGTTATNPIMTMTQTLSPEEQQLFNQQNWLGTQSNNAASLGLKQINSILSNPVSDTNLPALQTSLGATPQLATSYDQGGQIQTSVPVQQAATTFGNTAGNIQYDVDQQGIQQARDDATNAALARLQPSMDQQNAALQSQLANQGVSLGSSAYGAAMLNNAQQQNDLRLGAVQVGDAEQQALYGQALQSGQFHNAAQQQDYDQQQGRGQFQQQGTALNNAASLAAGSFANSAQAQQNAENAAEAAFGNQAMTGLFGMNQQAATFGNQAREQSLSDQESIRNNTVNQISSLMHGGQVTAGQYQGYSPGSIGETPISQDTYASANLAEQAYQTQANEAAANNSAMFSALGGLFGMGTRGGLLGNMLMPSDRRIKRDVQELGRAGNGLPFYAFRYVWDGDFEPLTFGHMADEVALVRPEAVHLTPHGYFAVDYGAL